MLVPSIRVDSQQVERIEATPAVQWMDWQKQATSFDAIAAYVWTFNFLQSFLFEVEPTDPATLAGAGLLFASVTLIACWVPTRRAAAVDPMEALRCD